MKKYLLTLSALSFSLGMTYAAMGVTGPAGLIGVDQNLSKSPVGVFVVPEIDFRILENKPTEVFSVPNAPPVMQEE